MKKSSLQQLFSKAAWRRWLDRLDLSAKATETREIGYVGVPVRHLGAQVSELRARIKVPS